MLITTSLYAALLALLILFLAYNVVIFRRGKQISLGDNGDKVGQRVIRAHANAVEYIPMMIILMALYESNNGSALILHIIGVISVLARVLHAMGLSNRDGKSFGRFYGTLLTWAVIVTLAGLNLYQYIARLIG